MKSKMIFLLLTIILASCQPMNSPTPEIQEVTRIVKQTSLVTQIVEQTVEVPKIVKESVVVTEFVNKPTPTATKFWDTEYNLPAHYFDAMLVVVQFYTFLETKQCEANYDLYSEWARPLNSKEDQINYCLDPEIKIELLSVTPYNYNLVSEGRNTLLEPEDLVFFEVLTKESYKGNVKNYHVWRSAILENGEWKIGKGGTSPPMYGSEYWNR